MIRALMLVLMIWCLPVIARAESLMVFAAASLADAVRDVAAMYERESGVEVELSFDASSALARQIIAGAPADIFISADEAKMDLLAENDLIIPATRKSLLANTLVIIGGRDAAVKIHTPEDILNDSFDRIALADPAAVPAGIYARGWLEQNSLWSRIEDRLVPLPHVRAVLAAVASGNADVGFVYRTDATKSKVTEVLFEIPPDETPGISYPVAIINRIQPQEAAYNFLQFLGSSDSRAIFERHGFGWHEELVHDADPTP